MQWFRLYHDLPFHRHMRRFSAQQKWAWVVLLCMASQSRKRGFICNETDEDMADYCGFESTQDYQFFLDKLRQKGMIEHVEEGIKVTDWEERQYIKPSDLPEATKERKRRQRAKEKESQEKESRVTSRDNEGQRVTSRHTDPDSDPDPEQNRLKKDDHQSLCSDDRDRQLSEDKIKPKPDGKYSAEFEALWLKFPRKIGKAKCGPLYERLVKDGEDPVLIEKRLDYDVATTWQDCETKYIPHPQTWFNRQDWNEDGWRLPDGSNNEHVDLKPHVRAAQDNLPTIDEWLLAMARAGKEAVVVRLDEGDRIANTIVKTLHNGKMSEFWMWANSSGFYNMEKLRLLAEKRIKDKAIFG